MIVWVGERENTTENILLHLSPKGLFSDSGHCSKGESLWSRVEGIDGWQRVKDDAQSMGINRVES